MCEVFQKILTKGFCVWGSVGVICLSPEDALLAKHRL